MNARTNLLHDVCHAVQLFIELAQIAMGLWVQVSNEKNSGGDAKEWHEDFPLPSHGQAWTRAGRQLTC